MAVVLRVRGAGQKPRTDESLCDTLCSVKVSYCLQCVTAYRPSTWDAGCDFDRLTGPW